VNKDFHKDFHFAPERGAQYDQHACVYVCMFVRISKNYVSKLFCTC